MSDDGYKVGPRKPPLHSRYKPGRSGNPGGRPKRPPQIEALIDVELDREISMVLDGVEMKVTNREMVAKRLVAAMKKGDMRAIGWFAKRMDKLSEAALPDDAAPCSSTF